MTRRDAHHGSATRPATPRRWWARLRGHETCEQCGRTGRPPYCDACGYELVRRTRAGAPKVPNV